MTVIYVPTLGKIKVSQSGNEIRDSLGNSRLYHEVTFENVTGKEIYTTSVGQPLSPGGNPFIVYDIVHAAMSFFYDDHGFVGDETDPEEWINLTEIPVGSMTVVESGPEHSHTWRIPVRQSYAGDAFSAMQRALRQVTGWDCYSAYRMTTAFKEWTIHLPDQKKLTIIWEGDILRSIEDVNKRIGDIRGA